LRKGWASTLLLSVARFEIRSFSKLELPSSSLDLLAIASTTPPELRHYFVTVGPGPVEAKRIDRGRFGTRREIMALSDWLREHPDIRSVMVVSSAFHLRRVRMCCRGLLPEGMEVNFVAVPEENLYLREHWWRDPSGRKLVLSELLKIVVYRLLCRRPKNLGDSSDVKQQRRFGGEESRKYAA
jgi:hypothetical protein